MNSLVSGTAFITGGAQGIGKQTALCLAKSGIQKIVLADRNTAMVQTAAQDIRDQYPKVEVLGVGMDVRNEEEVQSAIAEAVKFGGGRLDIAINNAGIEDGGLKTHEVSDETWVKNIDVNLTGLFRCQRAELRAMLNQEDMGPRLGRGVIVNLSSTSGIKGPSLGDNDTPYFATKFGVEGITRSDAHQYGKDKIRINSICPGAIRTPMFDAAMAHDTDGSMMNEIYRTPLGRVAEVEEIGDAIVFLASPMSSFMTGTRLIVDGGFTA